MNLLKYQNRSDENLTLDQITGYQYAMQDFIDYIKELTEFDPSKKMIDASIITSTIADTSFSLADIISKKRDDFMQTVNKVSGVRLSGSKVNDFLKAQIQDDGPNDLKGVNI